MKGDGQNKLKFSQLVKTLTIFSGVNDTILHEPINSYCTCEAVMNCCNNNT
jgi:hypothetical protein